jgi:hypothetical protein
VDRGLQQAVVPAHQADAPRPVIDEVALDDELRRRALQRADGHELLLARRGALERAAVAGREGERGQADLLEVHMGGGTQQGLAL